MGLKRGKQETHLCPLKAVLVVPASAKCRSCCGAGCSYDACCVYFPLCFWFWFGISFWMLEINVLLYTECTLSLLKMEFWWNSSGCSYFWHFPIKIKHHGIRNFLLGSVGKTNPMSERQNVSVMAVFITNRFKLNLQNCSELYCLFCFWKMWNMFLFAYRVLGSFRKSSDIRGWFFFVVPFLLSKS